MHHADSSERMDGPGNRPEDLWAGFRRQLRIRNILLTIEALAFDALRWWSELATGARAAAANEPLPQRRSRHEQSAERWEEMARQAEDTADRKVINDAARRANPYGQS